MKIEVGKTYRTRDGYKVEIDIEFAPLKQEKGLSVFRGRVGFPFPHEITSEWFQGGAFRHAGGTSSFDIISEWTEKNTDRAQLAALDASSAFNAQAYDYTGKTMAAMDRLKAGADDGSGPFNAQAHAHQKGQTLNSSDDAKAKTRIDVDYWPLKAILNEALEQASKGKGNERHANGRPFDRQPIMEHGRLTGPAGPSFQALKKIGEAQGMLARGEKDAAIRELLGAVVYACAAVQLIKEDGR